MNKELYKIVFEIYLNKKPNELFLELLMEYFWDFQFTELEFNELKKDSIEEHIKKIEHKYGINFPSYLLKIWFNNEFKLKENKLVLNKYIGLSISEIEDKFNKSKEEEKKFTLKLSEIREKFIEYCKKYKITISKEEAKSILLMYDYGTYSLYDDNEININDTELAKRQKQINLLFFEFSQELLKNEDTRDIIESCGISNQFSKMVFTRDVLYSKLFNNTTFYIDTPIILKYLGYAGVDIQQCYYDLLSSIKKCNSEIIVFPHVISEVLSIIYTLQLKVAQGFFNAPNVNEFLKAKSENKNIPIKEDDVINKIKGEIKIDNFNYTFEEKDFCNILIDEIKLKEYMLSEYKINNSNNNKSLTDARIEVDVKSTSLVSINKMMNKKLYFLLTPNYAFKKAVKRYHDENIKVKDDFYEVITENDVVFNLWQNSGNNFNDSFKTFFRLKCFSYLKIDDKFRDEFYIKYRRLYELQNKNADYLEALFVGYPNLLYTAYNKNLLKDEDYNTVFMETIDDKLKEIENNFFEKGAKSLQEKIKKTIEETVSDYNNKISDLESKMSKNNIKNKNILINTIKEQNIWIILLNCISFILPCLKNRITNFIDLYAEKKAKKIIDSENK